MLDKKNYFPKKLLLVKGENFFNYGILLLPSLLPISLILLFISLRTLELESPSGGNPELYSSPAESIALEYCWSICSGSLKSEQVISNFAAISLNQIPGDPDSIKGNKVRGVYWTKPDSTGVEVSRDVSIDESKYTEFVKDFQHTYFKEVYDELSKKYKLGRVRLLLKEPRSTLSWHRDPEPRLHIPIYTNPGAIMVIDKVAQHMPADGSVWVTNNLKYHNAFNGGEENRVHLVACVLDYKFN